MPLDSPQKPYQQLSIRKKFLQLSVTFKEVQMTQRANARDKNTLAIGIRLIVLLLAAQCPVLAFAAPPFAGGTTTLTTDLLTIVTPIAGIALIAVVVICWFGKVSWFWFGGLVIGIVLVFGNQQVVTWIQGLFSV